MTDQFYAKPVAPSSASASPTPPTPASSGASEPPQVVHAEPPRKRRWVVPVVILALVAVIVFSIASCTNALMGGSAVEASQPNTVAVIDLAGTIEYDGTSCSPEGLKYLLDQAESDPNIVAVVLRVNSGGGTATAGEEMATYVREFSKPVVVSSASINCSAAYEISSQADYIYVAQTTEIGSIGTIMQSIDYSQLLELLGVDVTNIASADSKDSSYGTRPLTEEEIAYYQDMVNQINDVFVQNVVDGRGMTEAEVRALATGLPFTGTQAIENGLADEVGTREDAIAYAAMLAGIRDDSYSTKNLQISQDSLYGLLDLLSSSSSNTSITAADLAAALKELNENDGIAQ